MAPSVEDRPGSQPVAGLPDAGMVCLVAQTTQERGRFLETARAVRERYRGLPAANIIAEPVGRDSAPAVGLAAYGLLMLFYFIASYLLFGGVLTVEWVLRKRWRLV